MPRTNRLHSTLLVAILLVVLGCGAGSAAAATGGTSAPSGGGTVPASSSGSQHSTGSSSPATSTGGVSPSSVRPPTAPVKAKKKKRHRRKKRRRRHHAAPAPAPAAPAPAPAPGQAGDIPARFLAAYRAAGERYGVDWRILAAIGRNESDHGRSTAPGVLSGRNYADCCSGPMQICTVKSCSKVWQHYAVDGDGDGLMSVYDPDDAIFAAAWLVHDLVSIVGDDPELVLAAYNAGPGNVRHYDGVPPFPETRAYVRAGLEYIASLR